MRSGVALAALCAVVGLAARRAREARLEAVAEAELAAIRRAQARRATVHTIEMGEWSDLRLPHALAHELSDDR